MTAGCEIEVPQDGTPAGAAAAAPVSGAVSGAVPGASERFLAKEEAARERVREILAGLRDLPWPGESRDWVEQVAQRRRLLGTKVREVRHTAEAAIPLGRFTWTHRSSLEEATAQAVPRGGGFETGITADGRFVLMDASLPSAGMGLAGGQDIQLGRALERAVGHLVPSVSAGGATAAERMLSA